MNTQDAIVQGELTEKNIQFYKEYGYLIAPKLMDDTIIESLTEETIRIVRGDCGAIEGLLDIDKNTSDNDVLKRYAAIHFPHKISEVMKAAAGNEKIANILSGIISPNVKCLQTMLFMKAPGKKGQSWHQDEYYIPTRDRSLTGAWVALEDADEDNGCLWVIPGSHKDGFIRKRIPNSNESFADVDLADITPYKEKDFVKVEAAKGSVIFFNGYLLHMSKENKTTDRYRKALVGHYSSAESMLPWDLDGRLDFTHDNRDIFMVSGNDPYAYKGIADLSKPFVRPDVLEFNTDTSREKLKKENQ